MIVEPAFFQRADRLRHPLIFYYGHTAVHFINKLVLTKILSQKDRIDPKIESLFAVGVDEMSTLFISPSPCCSLVNAVTLGSSTCERAYKEPRGLGKKIS